MLKYGADPTLADHQGYTPLHLVAQYAHLPLLLFLLAKIPSSQIDPFDSRKCTPLMWACYNNAPLPVLKALIFFGASLTTTDDNGFTPIHWACVRQNILALRILTKYGSDLEVKDNNDKTPEQLWIESSGKNTTFRNIVRQEQGLRKEPETKLQAIFWSITPDVVRGIHSSSSFASKLILQSNTSIALYILPFVNTTYAFALLAILDFNFSIWVVPLSLLLLHLVASHTILRGDTARWAESRYLPGIMHSTILLIIVQWLRDVVYSKSFP